MAICGRSCSITGASIAAAEGHAFTLTSNAPEIDVSSFGSGSYGDWLACFKDGEVSVSTYLDPGVDAGDVATVVMNVGNTSYTATNALVTSKNISVDAKALVEFETTFKLVGDLT
jgi:hypothetical protein